MGKVVDSSLLKCIISTRLDNGMSSSLGIINFVYIIFFLLHIKNYKKICLLLRFIGLPLTRVEFDAVVSTFNRKKHHSFTLPSFSINKILFVWTII